MKHLLVIGAGYVGEVLVEMARERGWMVTAVRRSGVGGVACDVSDLDSVRALAGVVDGVTHVVHCASAGGGGVEGYREVYLRGCEHLVEVFAGAHLLFTSSTSVFGQEDGGVVTEESETAPETETGEVLLAAERMVLGAGGTVARLAGVYGEGRSYLLKRFLAGEAVIEEDGSRWVNHTHRRDAASGCLFLLELGDEARGEIFHVCDSTPMRQREVYAGLCEKFDKLMPPSGPRKTGLKRGWSDKAVSNAKMKKAGWEPAFGSWFDAVDGIVDTL